MTALHELIESRLNPPTARRTYPALNSNTFINSDQSSNASFYSGPLFEARKHLGMSRSELAEEIGLSANTIRGAELLGRPFEQRPPHICAAIQKLNDLLPAHLHHPV